MLLLAIDWGNTWVKWRITDQDIQVEDGRFAPDDALSAFGEIQQKFPDLQHVVLSSVGQSDVFLNELNNRFSNVTILNAQSAVPFTNAYATPHTLGIDRMVLAVAAVQLFPKQAALLIDCGSCITYDWLDEKGVYYGGAISPGLQMRYDALHQFTARLPLLAPQAPKDFPGNSTADSIHLGVVQSTVYEIEGFIQAQQAKHANFILILTGGDAEFLAEQLKSPIFVRPTFQLEGLCAWYQYLHS